MTPSIRVRAWVLTSAFTAATMLLAGCAGEPTTATDASAVSTGLVGDQADGGEPTPGGTFSFATYNSVSSLDPANRQDGGATGGGEMAAIYDLLVRYDLATREFEPQLAQSLTSNGENTVWTLTLRENAAFSDGTPVDADAVQWSINLYLEKKGTHAQVWTASVDRISSPDAKTIVFTLEQPWDEFPILFTTGPGMVVAPSSRPHRPVSCSPILAIPTQRRCWPRFPDSTRNRTPDSNPSKAPYRT